MRDIGKVINDEKKAKIGGLNQYIQARGIDSSNPILLYLHGGPGIPTSVTADLYQKQLEKEFIVVNWDQRGAGKSYSPDIPAKSMNLEQLIRDAKDVIDYLLSKYRAEKLYLVGQSFGSVLGLLIAKTYPDKLYAYISTGQLIDANENEKVSYSKAYQEAKRIGNTEAITELEAIGLPPYNDVLKGVAIQRKWLNSFGFIERRSTVYQTIKENTTEEEFLNIMAGSEFSVTHLFTDIFKKEVNLFSTVKEVRVPIFFCLGKYDYATPSLIASSFLKQLKAEAKEAIWFNESGHFPEYDETEKFVDVLSQIKRSYTV